MNCNSFANVVVDLARSQTLDGPVRDAALAHASMCEACGKRLAEEKLLTGGLQALSAELKTMSAPDRLQHNLVSAFRQQSFVSQVSQRNDRRRYLAIAAAVVMAVALGIVAYSIRQQQREGSRAVSVPPAEVPRSDDTREAKQLTPPVRPAVAVVPRKTYRRREVIKRRTREPRSTVPVQSTFVTVVVGAVADPERPEVMSPFMPVSYSNPVNAQESAQVVRVELPRYAMARFGLPVNMERYDERVKADVWLGADGLAKAIRFVQ